MIKIFRYLKCIEEKIVDGKVIECHAKANYIVETKEIIPTKKTIHNCGMNGDKAKKALFEKKLKENLKTDTGKPFRTFTNTKEK